MKKAFSSKGLSLPINSIVIIAIAVIVLLVITGFFMSSTGETFGTIEATRIFNAGCSRYCYSGANPFQEAYGFSGKSKISSIGQSEQDFLKACVSLGYLSEAEKYERPSKCLEYCGGCDFSTHEGDIDSGFNDIQDRIPEPR